MGLMDKVKKILFDEEDVEVTVSDGELPERTPKDKKVKKETREEKSGFIDYHHEEEVDENPIKEVKVPEYEKVETKKFNLPEDDFNDVLEEEDKEISRFSGLDDMFKEEKEEVKEINRFTTIPKREETKERVIKDYRKILGESTKEEEHKPFQNTPIISPVWGVLDKNYTPEDIVEKKDELTKVNVGAAAPRTYGPVSYNDEPLPGVKMKKKETVKEEVEEEPKEDVVELSNTISEMMDEKVEDETAETMKRIESVVEEEIVPTHTVDEIDDSDDDVIQTEGYDEYDSINNTYSVDTNIEDAFESTSEYESINNRDNEDDDKVDLDALINKKDDDEDDSGLDDTIETDLFNLIDSMYKDKEDE